MNLQRRLLYLLLAGLVLGGWLGWLWQPERQLKLHTTGLLASIERRNWNKVQGLLADDYLDRWGHDKTFVLGGLRQVFGSFLFLKIEPQILAIDTLGRTTRVRVKMSGQGGPVADYVTAKVNGLSEPFTLAWIKGGAGPWDWKLIAVDHPTLDPDAEPQF